MILIADGGSTSCDWVFMNSTSQEIIGKIKTKGLNPAYSSSEDLESVLHNSNELLQIKSEVSAIYFFGAGCNSDAFAEKLKNVFLDFFSFQVKIRIRGDIQGAVYACTNMPAVVGILGTGSNICYFDGSEIHTSIDSLGYSIMDDGAGSALGRLLLRAYFYKQLPRNVSEDLASNYNVNPDFVKENIYHKAFPGRFLASYAKFVFDNLHKPKIEQLLKQNLNNYFDTHVQQFDDELQNVPIFFVGSIAHFSKKHLAQMCTERGYKLGGFIQRPIDTLAHNFNYYF